MDKQGTAQEEKLSKKNTAEKTAKKHRWIPITVVSVISGAIVVVGTLMALAMYIPSVNNYFDTILMKPEEYYTMVESAHIAELYSYSDKLLPDTVEMPSAVGTYGGELSYDGKDYTFKAILSERDAQINIFDANTHKPDTNLWFRNDSMFLRMPEVSDDILKSADTVGGGLYLDYILNSEKNIITSSELNGLISKYMSEFYRNADEVSYERGLKGTLGAKEYKCTAINVTYRDGKAEDMVVGMLTDMKNDNAAKKVISAYFVINQDEVDEKLDEMISDIKQSGDFAGNFTMKVYTDSVGNVIGRDFGKYSFMFIQDEDETFEMIFSVAGKDEQQYSFRLSGSSEGDTLNGIGSYTLWVDGTKYSLDFEIADFHPINKNSLLYKGQIKLKNTTIVLSVDGAVQNVKVTSQNDFLLTLKRTSDNDKVKIPYSEIYLYETEYEEYLKHANSDALMRLYDKQMGFLF